MSPILKTNADLQRTLYQFTIGDYFKSSVVTAMCENFPVGGHFADEASSQEWKRKSKF